MGKVITQPAEGEPVPEPKAADWKGEENTDETAEAQAKHSDGVTSGRRGGAALTVGASIAMGAEMMKKELGLRKETPESTNISRANSIRDNGEEVLRKGNELEEADRQEEDEGVRALGPDGWDLMAKIHDDSALGLCS